MNAEPTPMSPREVQYRGYTITLTHRVKTNDWTYTINHVVHMTLSQAAPRYESALRLAKHDVDVLLRPTKGKAS